MGRASRAVAAGKPGRVRRLRTACLAQWAALRRRMPHALQDALTHLPTSVTASTPALCSEQGWRCSDLGPGSHRPIGPVDAAPSGFGARLAREAAVCASWPQYVAEVPGGRVLGGACSAVAPGGVVLADASPHHWVPIERHRAMVNSLWAPPPRRLPGTSALVGASGHRNYYHWMFDMVPRIELILAAGGGGSIDRWILPRTPLGAAGRVLELCGVHPSRVHWHGRGAHVECERLVVSSPPAPLGGATARSVAFLRDRCIPRGLRDRPDARRRLFLARKATRRVANMEAVVPVLRKHGVEVVTAEGLSFDEQVRLFAGASLLVGAHGAGLTNAIFMPAGSALVEIVPSWYAVACYLVMANEAGLRYRVIEGGEAGGSGGTAHRDLSIDPDALDAQLAAAIAAGA